MYEEILEQNRGLVTMLARRYARACEMDRAVSLEDLTQAGYLGLMRAAESFDGGAGKTWASWAAWHIRRECDRALGLRYGRFTRPHSGAEALDRPVGRDAADPLTVGDLLGDDRLADPDAAILLNELRRSVWEAVASLPDPQQRRAVRLCKLEGLSYRDAAPRLGVSPRRAAKLCDRAGVVLARDERLRRLVWRQ